MSEDMRSDRAGEGDGVRCFYEMGPEVGKVLLAILVREPARMVGFEAEERLFHLAMAGQHLLVNVLRMLLLWSV